MFLCCVHPGPDLTPCAMGPRRALQFSTVLPVMRFLENPRMLKWLVRWDQCEITQRWTSFVHAVSKPLWQGSCYYFNCNTTVLIPDCLCWESRVPDHIDDLMSAKGWYNFTLRWCMISEYTIRAKTGWALTLFLSILPTVWGVSFLSHLL